MKIGIVANYDKPQAADCVRRIVSVLRRSNAEIMTLADKSALLDLGDVRLLDSHEALFAACDAAVTVGGDGTIIHSARHACVAAKPVIGVNLGRLGYVAELEVTELDMLCRIASGDYRIQNRMVLDVSVMRDNTAVGSYIAVNDAVVSRGALSRMIDLSVELQGERISSYRADGLLLSTPTGSTAYALSAGGPVISPELSCIELTPVCPHEFSARSIIFSDDSVLRVTPVSPDSDSYLTVDGQISVKLGHSDSVEIKRSDFILQMISLKNKNFYTLASEKLKEGQS